MKEYTRAPRYLTNEKASVEIYGKEGSVIADLKNLSRTGACIEWIPSDFIINPRDLVRMTVSLPSLQKSHNLNGEIVWRKDKISGLYFLNAGEIFERLLSRSQC